MPKGKYDKGAWLSRKVRPEFKKIKMQEGEVKIHCKRCKKTFLANNYRCQYCESCKKDIRRENNWKGYQRRKEKREELRCKIIKMEVKNEKTHNTARKSKARRL